MNEWLVKHFRKDGRPKCLFLIGPTLTGKTTFALLLPGIPNHYRGYWTIDRWNDQADYIVMDDIPWHEYQQRGFPNPQDLLTDQKFVSVNNKYGKIKTIDTAMPAIVLMNPHHAVELLKLLDGDDDDPMASFWRERSFLHIMEQNEYFHQPTPPQQPAKQHIYTVDHLPLFQEARRRWHDGQQQKQIHDIPAMESPRATSDNASELSEEYSFDNLNICLNICLFRLIMFLFFSFFHLYC